MRGLNAVKLYLAFALTIAAPIVLAQSYTKQSPIKSYILPPVNTCSKLEWRGDRWAELTAVNSCPAAIDVDVVFSDGIKIKLYCDAYEACIAKFHKERISQNYKYWVNYATE
jgi:hypothetical protein